MKIEEYTEIIAYLRGIITGSEFEEHLYSVGGCERDKHLIRLHDASEIKDIDLVLDIPDGGIKFAKWLDKKGLLVSAPVIYEHYGTAMFHLKAFPNEELEAVQTRKESYRDIESRNPETAYGTIMEDCVRRDFTINALYHNISTGKDLDLTDKGLEDLQDGLIRATANPDIIFFEDPLRIMRAIRFACKYGFEIEDETYSGIKKYAERLSIISAERITDEFTKIITSERLMTGLILLIQTGIFKIIFPEILDPDSFLKAAHLKCSSSIFEKENNSKVIAFFSALFYGRPREVWEGALRRMKYPTEIIKGVEKMHECREILGDYKNFKNKKIVHHIQYLCGTREMYYTFLAFVEYFHHLDWYSDVRRCDDSMYGYKLPINGFDIMNRYAITSGKEVKKKLDILMDKAYDNPNICDEECYQILDGKKGLWNKICSIFK